MARQYVDPSAFNFGNAFLGGIAQANQEQRQNALLDMERGQFDLQNRRQAMMEDEYLRSLQAQDAQAQQAQQSRAVYARLFEEAGLPPELADTEGADELAQHLMEQKIGGGGELPADVQSAIWYQNASPEQRAAFNVTKRNPIAPVMAIVNGVPTLVQRAPGSEGNQIPLSSPEAEQAFASQKEAAVTRAGEGAKVQVAAQADLPRVKQNADQAIKALDELDSSEGFDKIFGVYSLAPVIPGTSQADAFAKWEQIQGKAFLEAFQSLKGGGQITEVEGQKATAAITSLANRKQSPAAAKKAIRDLKEVVRAGLRRAEQKAKQFGGAPGAPKRVKVDEEGNVIGN